MEKLTCFKAYDIRGQLDTELNEDVAYRIGRAYAEVVKAKNVVVGGDARQTSESLKLAVAKGLQEGGCNVIDIGMVGTEEIYFATSHLKVDGGIEITASHNPIDYNGLKLVREQSKPISGDTGLLDIKALAEKNEWANLPKDELGTYTKESNLTPYVDHLLTYINTNNIKPLKLVVNSGNGAAGHVIDALELQFKSLNVPIEFVKVHHNPDHTFPNGIPNPLLPENRAATTDAVKLHNADMGIAWDGDFDRCFLFDETGEFIEGYYIVGLLAEAFLVKNPGEKVIFDPRVYWNTVDIVKSNNGIPVMSKTGHAFIKERMRKEDAIYGGEMSAHHYFRDFAYCDSGMIPWLLVSELLSLKSIPLSEMVKERIAKFPSSGEINRTVESTTATIKKIEQKYSALPNAVIDRTDGLGIEFPQWRFNLRKSNTEPLIRLNVESKKSEELMQNKTEELIKDLQTTSTLRGAIDTYNNGELRGWAIDNLHSKSINLHVMCGEQIVGSGRADIYRKDLDESGFNNGKHAFKIKLDESFLGENTVLTLADADTLTKIDGASKTLSIEKAIFSCEIIKEENGYLVVSVLSKNVSRIETVELVYNSAVINSKEIAISDVKTEVKLLLPENLRDNQIKEFSLRLQSSSEVLVTASILISSVKAQLFFYPDYRATNPYQELLYSNLTNCNVGSSNIDEAIEYLTENNITPCVFHVHWQNVVTASAKNSYEHRKFANEFISKLNYFKELGGKVFWTIHNKLPHDIKFKSSEIEYHESMAETADIILLHDESSINIVTKEYLLNKDKINIIQHGNYIDSYPNFIKSKESRSILHINQDDIVFGFVGQLRPYKGLNDFIEASVKLVNMPNVSALIAGKPVWPITKGKIERRCELYDDIKVYEGFVPDEELQVYLNSSDFIVLPYKDILTSGSVILAASFGKPIVVPDIPAFESIKNEDFIFTYSLDDKQSLYLLLTKLSQYKKSTISELGKSALKFAMYLDWNRISKELSDLIQSNVNSNSKIFQAELETQIYEVEVLGNKHHEGMAICVVNYFSSDLLRNLVDTLNKYCSSPYTLYILDNSESKTEFNRLKSYFTDAILLNTKSNLGYAAGNNILVNYAKCQGATQFAILNPDMLLCEDVMDYMANITLTSDGIHSPVILRENELVSFHSTIINQNSDTLQVEHRYAGLQPTFLPEGIQESDSLNGCALFFSSSTIDKYGYIPEEYFLYFEETDWTWSSKKKGANLFVHSDIKIIHTKDSQKGGLPTLAYTYYLLRGALLFAAKHSFDMLHTRNKFENTFVKAWVSKIKIRQPELENVFLTITNAAFEDGLKGVTGKVDLFEKLEEYSVSNADSFGIIESCNGSHISGWAVADKNNKALKSKLLFYVAGTYKGCVEPSLLREDISELGFNIQAGFSHKIDIDDYSKLEIIDSNSLKSINKNYKNLKVTTAPKLFNNKSSSFKSSIEGVKNGKLSGWAIDVNNQNITLDLGVYIDNEFVTSVIANSYRADLAEAKLNNGYCSFTTIIPPHYLERDSINISLKLLGDENTLSQKSVKQEIIANGYNLNFNLNSFLNWSYVNVITPYGMYEKSHKLQRELAFIKNNLVNEASSLKEQIFISVIMPAYNRTTLIKDSIDSILKQTYQNYELIVIDDGSDDDTCDVVKEIIANNKHVKIKLIELGENSGVSFARNRGLEKASGEIITYLDSDNIWDESYLSLLNHTYINNQDCDSVYAGQEIYYFDKENNRSFQTAIRLLPFNRSKIENENFIDLNVFSHRRVLFDALGGFKEELRRLVDWDLIVRYTESKPPVLIPVLLNKYFFGLADNQITSTENYEKNLTKLLEGL